MNGPVMTQPLFLGFHTVEKLADELAAAGNHLVYIMPLAEITGAHEVGLKDHSLTVQGLARGGVIAYCRVGLGHYEVFSNGTPFDEERARAVTDRVVSAEALIKSWLQARGFEVVEGTFAGPKNYRMLNGTAGFLSLDRSTNTFEMKGDGP